MVRADTCPFGALDKLPSFICAEEWHSWRMRKQFQQWTLRPMVLVDRADSSSSTTVVHLGNTLLQFVFWVR